mmetsp:Transcript_31311/g.53467  ORF Transcript_31311/g.53467 Transcript_31311/m.53467 type:complete len:380 (+) Transcript_31311:60-1199(+)|eukprot:CAMPEP_0183728304 /NCGR_PEP_ID=MMETSP0737-20130205/27689_1 /TAXON_ID=385413 /ORGANISM="Thalassiosira miniscula, Strain CCMP1093" /LENGTH=379 /DNA_ID=CAMNT_0025960205 /DNA_START=125 /DNA_END=1264 /DNA_ORIENTATION=+
MRATTILSILGSGTAAAASSSTRGGEKVYKKQFERALSGSGDISFDDDFWGYDTQSMDVVWDDYSIIPEKCMIYKKKHVIAFNLYGKGHNQCSKKKEGTYLMDVGYFAKAYVAQKQVDYKLAGNDYGGVDALDYVECTAVEYNDAYYYAKLGCSSQGGLKILAYSDEYCSQETNQNIGLYNDAKIQFGQCQTCVSWPAQVDGDDDANQIEVDDQFDYYHEYDSKLCGAAAVFKEDCGWGCRREVKKANKAANANKNASQGKGFWGGFEKFCLFLFSFTGCALVWVVLKQRRMMSREDAIVEEAAMNGVGLKKRHVFPIALGVIFVILFAMFMVWKKLTWFLLIGVNIGLFAHFVFLRRKAKKSGAGGDGYIKDAGLEIS